MSSRKSDKAAVMRKRAQRIADGALRAIVNVGAAIVAAEVRKRVPVRTGALRSTIRVVSGRVSEETDALEQPKRGTAAKAVFIGDPKRVPYAFFLEFGTSRMRPRPFMRPALDAAIEIARIAAIATGKKSIGP